MSFFDTITAFITNIAGDKIDPATEQKQDDIITDTTAANVLLGTIDADTGQMLLNNTNGTHRVQLVNSLGTQYYVYQDDEIGVPAAVTEDIFHYAVHEKLAFMTTHEASLASGAEFNLSFKTPVTTPIFHLLYQFHGANEVVFTIQENAVVTDNTGSDHAMSCRNRLSTVPYSAAFNNATGAYAIDGNINLDGTITTEGNIVNGPTGQHAGANRGAGADDAAFEFVLALDTVYVMKITNDSNQTAIYSLELNWFEVPPA